MRAICRGDIFHRFFDTTIPPKYKFFVVVGEDSKNYVGYFFINSNINQFVSRNKEMSDMQMPLKPENYPFLKYVSFIGGHQLAFLKKSELIEELSSGKTQIKGHVNDDDIQILLDAALESPLFSAKEKEYFK